MTGSKDLRTNNTISEAEAALKLGIAAFNCFVGRPLDMELSEDDCRYLTKDIRPRVLTAESYENFKQTCPFNIYKLIKDCLNSESSARPTLQQIIEGLKPNLYQPRSKALAEKMGDLRKFAEGFNTLEKQQFSQSFKLFLCMNFSIN